MIWNPDAEPAPQPANDRATVFRFVIRAVPFLTICGLGLLLLVILRFPERWIYGMRRPFTPYITQGVCRAFLWIAGIGFSYRGTPMSGQGPVVANHSCWLDIFTLHAAKRVYYVSKAEVRGWPGIGILARATGTIFINRVRTEAKAQEITLRERLIMGHKLLFFPEGTSTDSMRVLPFKTSLFAAFYHPDLRDKLSVQPVTVVYHAPEGKEPTFYGWWGDMDFGSHLLKVLAAPRQGHVEIMYHLPVNVCDFPDRKSLAKFCEETVRTGHDLLAQEARDPASVDLPRSTQQ